MYSSQSEVLPMRVQLCETSQLFKSICRTSSQAAFKRRLRTFLFSKAFTSVWPVMTLSLMW